MATTGLGRRLLAPDRWLRSPNAVRCRLLAGQARSRSRSRVPITRSSCARLDHGGRAVAFGLELEPHAAGDHGQEAVRGNTAPATTRRPFPSAPRVGRRRSLVDTSGRSMLNRRATSCGSRPGPSSSTKYPPSISPAATRVSVSSALSASSFRTRRRNRFCGDASLLLQALDGAEGGPVADARI